MVAAVYQLSNINRQLTSVLVQIKRIVDFEKELAGTKINRRNA